jgi:ribosomal protein L22
MSEDSEKIPETTAAAEASEPTEALTEDLSAEPQKETSEAEVLANDAADQAAADEAPTVGPDGDAIDVGEAEYEAQLKAGAERTDDAAAADDEAPKAKAAAKPKAKKAPAKAKKADEADEADSDGDDEAAAAETSADAEKPAKAEPKAKKAEKAKQPEVPAEVRAQAKYVRSSARKARLVCDNIRGKSVEEARAILAHTPRSVAEDWSKLLESAVANAEHNHELDGDDLVIKTVTADEGPTIKRFRPRAQGRATPIRKRTSHLTILLTTKD